MTVLLLLGSAVALAVAAPAWLLRAGWTNRAPRLGVLAWHTAAATLVVCVIAAAQIMIMPWHQADDAICMVWRLCLDALVGAHGRAAQVMAWTGAAVLLAVTIRIAVAGVQLARAAARRRRHTALVRLIGHHRADIGATVVDHPDSAVYLIPGRSREVVVTTGAISRLDREELAAVLAHERAHARGRHHLSLMVAVLLCRAFPAAVFRHAERQIHRLVELCADEQACRHHSRLVLARALVALATPASPPGMLAAAGGDALERVHRLMRPPAPLPRRVTAIATAMLLTLPLLPLALVVAIPAVPALRAGLPL
ncbi:M56 family metallopeptidase [Micromonospora sp. CPCC 206061]|uniref:M56 family metallopeptidase n=1 Tax=Micromonospora sp. CPCC 206061 TaxID=3122410 RepID=UPI002FF1A4D5